MSRRTYSLDFKVSAAKLVTEQGRGLKDAAISLGVVPSTMPSWVRRFSTAKAFAPVPADHDPLREENKRLITEREIANKSDGLFRQGAGLIFGFLRSHRDQFSVMLMCHILKISRAGDYAWLGRPESPRGARRSQIIEEIRHVHPRSRGTYGSSRVYQARWRRVIMTKAPKIKLLA